MPTVHPDFGSALLGHAGIEVVDRLQRVISRLLHHGETAIVERAISVAALAEMPGAAA